MYSLPLFKTDNGQKAFAYRRAHLRNRFESEVKKHHMYLHLNISFDIFLVLCYFSAILVLQLGYLLLLYIFILYFKLRSLRQPPEKEH